MESSFIHERSLGDIGFDGMDDDTYEHSKLGETEAVKHMAMNMTSHFEILYMATSLIERCMPCREIHAPTNDSGNLSTVRRDIWVSLGFGWRYFGSGTSSISGIMAELPT